MSYSSLINPFRLAFSSCLLTFSASLSTFLTMIWFAWIKTQNFLNTSNLAFSPYINKCERQIYIIQCIKIHIPVYIFIHTPVKTRDSICDFKMAVCFELKGPYSCWTTGDQNLTRSCAKMGFKLEKVTN